MRFSIIIPTCNRPKELQLCLKALDGLISASECDEVEVIITDDGQRQPVTEEVIRDFPWARRVKGPSRGPAANRNCGAEAATGDVLLFLDDDCIPQSGYLRNYVSFWKDQDVNELICAYGPTIPLGQADSLLYEAPANTHGEALISSNFGISKEVLLSVGRFDERYPSAAFEDTEFFERFKRLGGRTVFISSAAVGHPYRKLPTAKNLAKKWEAKVIYALDQGARPLSLHYRIPWHVFCVITSRFRGKQLSLQNAVAALLFAREWIWTLILCPVWIAKWSRRKRSSFWVAQRDSGPPIPRHGL
jgi:GT2 family glycosyltransferase